MDIKCMIGGEAGQGVQSVGFMLAKTFTRGGLHVFADQNYESRVRGGHNFFRVRVSDSKVGAASESLDVLIALNRESIDLHQGELDKEGIIVFDSEMITDAGSGSNLFGLPLQRLAEEKTGNKVMANTVALGAAAGLINWDFDILVEILQEEFARHGDRIAEGNVVAARAGYGYAREHKKLTKTLRPVNDIPRRMLLNGNEAIALGAMAGGCKFIAGYPMTPASAIMEYMASKSKDFNIVAVHVEDEIAAINMAVGAGYTGVRSMVATSGGGFCLMVEGLALAGMTETPVVIVLGQRPGPATGMPTRTEQGELEFALHAGHGEFPRAVLAPSDAEEAFYTAVKAFNMAEKCQTPIIILSDHHLATSYSTVEKFDLGQIRIDRGAILSDEEANGTTDYQRHLNTESGISPRAFPFQGKALVVTDSDEHDEAGHMIEDAETRNQQNLKRLRKLDGLRMDIDAPRFHQSPNAEFTLIGWGSSRCAINEAATLLERDGVPVNSLHLSDIWPFPAEAVSSALDNTGARSIVVESNATAQMARLIRRETGYKVDGSILKYDGRPLTPQYIIDQLKNGGF